MFIDVYNTLQNLVFKNFIYLHSRKKLNKQKNKNKFKIRMKKKKNKNIINLLHVEIYQDLMNKKKIEYM